MRLLLMNREEESHPMTEVTTVGLDVAKSVFQVHGVHASGKPVIWRSLRPSQVPPIFEKLPPCLVGISAARIKESRSTPRSNGSFSKVSATASPSQTLAHWSERVP
jgi:hypothetical protein